MEFPVLAHKNNLQAIVHPGTESIITVPNLLTPVEAQACIDYAESLGFRPQGSRGPAYGEAYRDNDRVQVQDEAIADMLWHQTGLSKLLKSYRVDGQTAVGCNPNIRFYRYGVGHRFGKHIDDSVDLEAGRRTWYTVLIYLSGPDNGVPANASESTADKASSEDLGRGKRAKRPKQPAAEAPGQAQQAIQEHVRSACQDLQGGETVFYGHTGKRVASIEPRPGLAMLHLHGEDRCLEHEALAVKKGTKYVLRTDIVFE